MNIQHFYRYWSCTTSMWRNRFIAGGLAALGDEMWPGAPRQIGNDRVERAVPLTLEEAPKRATHWSCRALAARTGLSQSTVGRIWRAFGSRPLPQVLWTGSIMPFLPILRSIWCWTTMLPTRRREFGHGSCDILATTCTSIPRTVHG